MCAIWSPRLSAPSSNWPRATASSLPAARAPGVYVAGRKLASLGLRVRRGGSYHGLALNVNMDLGPFGRINPCGYAGLEMTQLAALGGPADVAAAGRELAPLLLQRLAPTGGG